MNIAYFKNGRLYDVSPRHNPHDLFGDREIAYHADIIVSDGREYDLSSADDIKAIHIPTFSSDIPSVLEMSYILKIRCGTIENASLVPAFIEKTLDLMQASRFIWHRRDYLQVIRNFYRCGMFEEGDTFETAYRACNRDLFSDRLREPSKFLKLLYKHHLLQERTENKRMNDEQEHIRTKEYFRRKWIKHNEYVQIKAKLPQIAPDTVRGYLQMRGRRTARFMRIKEEAEAVGIVIDLNIQ